MNFLGIVRNFHSSEAMLPCQTNNTFIYISIVHSTIRQLLRLWATFWNDRMISK
jgi:hypothetical protein